MNQALFDKMWAKLTAEASKPTYVVLALDVAAVFAVCGFLRWGAEDVYTVEEWAKECDIYLLVHP